MEIEKIQKKILTLIFFTILIDLVGFGMFIPILPQIAREFHVTDVQIALLATWFAFASFLSGGFIGYISDMFGRKKVLLITIGISILSQILTGIADSYILLVFAKVLSGIAAGNIATAQACISDITSTQDRGRYMYIIGLAFGGGFTVGPVIGTSVLYFIDIFQLFHGSYLFGIAFTAALLNVLNLIFIAYQLPETHYKFANVSIKGMLEKINPEIILKNNPTLKFHKQIFLKTLSQFMKIKLFFIFMIILFIQVLAFSGIETLLPFILKDAYTFSNLEIYKSYIVIGALSIAANAIIARKMLKKFRESFILKCGSLLLMMGMIGIPLGASNPYFLFLSISLLCTGIAIANPALNTLISSSSPQEFQGFGFGIAQTISSLAKIIGPALLGFTYQYGLGSSHFIREKSLYISAIILFTGFLIGLYYLNNKHQKT